MASNQDIQGMANLFKQFIISQQTGGSRPKAGFGEGATPDFDPQFWDEYRDISKAHTQDFKKITEDHAKSIRKENEDFFQKTAGMGLKMAPIMDAIFYGAKFGINRPAELMGGSAGLAMRAGLERSSAAGTMATDIMAAVTGMLVGGPAGLAAGGIMAGMGRGGLGTILGDMFLGNKATEQGYRQNYVQQYQQQIMGDEQAGMFRARTGRLQTQANAWGSGMDVYGGIRQLKFALNEDPTVMQNAIAEAFKIGGAKGIQNIDFSHVERMVTEGYGTAAEIMSMQSVAGRYGYGKNSLQEMADQTGLPMDQVLAAMQQSSMQFALFRAGTADMMNKMIANTAVGAMNPQLGLATANRIGQGVAGVSDEPGLMLQYRAFRQANPGADYVQFRYAKGMGLAASPELRRMSALIAQQGASGGPEDVFKAAALLGTQNYAEIPGISTFMQQMDGPRVKRAGPRTTSADERFAGVYGYQGGMALDDNMRMVDKAVAQFGGSMKAFADHVSRASADISKSASEVAGAVRTIIKQEEAIFKRAGGNFADPGIGYIKQMEPKSTLR